MSIQASTTAQVVDYLQSNSHVTSYLEALHGKNVQGPGKPDMTVFANNRAYTALFDTPVENISTTTVSSSLIDLVGYGIMPNPVTDVLFSKRNVKFLQSKCIEAIYKKTNYLIEPQGEDQLAQIMLRIYNEIPLSDYENNVRAGVSYLNSFILNIYIEYVQRSLIDYLEYKKFVSQGVIPIDRPVNVNIKGTKTIEYTNT